MRALVVRAGETKGRPCRGIVWGERGDGLSSTCATQVSPGGFGGTSSLRRGPLRRQVHLWRTASARWRDAVARLCRRQTSSSRLPYLECLDRLTGQQRAGPRGSTSTSALTDARWSLGAASSVAGSRWCKGISGFQGTGAYRSAITARWIASAAAGRESRLEQTDDQIRRRLVRASLGVRSTRSAAVGGRASITPTGFRAKGRRLQLPSMHRSLTAMPGHRPSVGS